MKLSLDSLTVTDTEPAELIRAAKGAGFDQVSLWVQPPPFFPLQLVTPSNAKACMSALEETGIGVGALEVFVLSSAEAIQSYRPAFELGARLGGKTASSINVGNADPVKVGELFAQFAELAREYGLGATHEPLAMFETKTLTQARDIVGCARLDAGIVVDAFHVVRAGGTVADVQALDPRLIWHVQLCDGAALSQVGMSYEASFERLYPGDGEFPLVELFRDAPTDVSWGIEAPSVRRAKAGMSAEQQAHEAMAAMLRVIDQIPSAKKSLGRCL
jgi:sugar phosphate isomerase/epimerase